jgi:hypothetical protein
MPSLEYIAGDNVIMIDIRDRYQNIVGPGPIMTCLGFSCDTLLSQPGVFTARFPANDERLQLLQLKKHFLDFYVNGELVFYGIAETSNHQIGNDGERTLVISGRDTLAELDETTLDFLYYWDIGQPFYNAPFYVIQSYNDTNGYDPHDITSWYLTKEVSSDEAWPITETLVYGAFAGEPALSGLTRIAEHIGEAFRLARPGEVRPKDQGDSNFRRHVEWLGTRRTSSGVRAIQSAGDAITAEDNPLICFIQNVSSNRNTTRMMTQIHPYGSGIGETRLDLSGTSRVAPEGFTFNEFSNYISSDSAIGYIGKTIKRHVNFKDIRPLFNTDADVRFAKDYLFDAALAYLQRNDDIDDNLEYDLQVIALPRTVKVGMTIRVQYQDELYDLDEDFVILGIRVEVASQGEISYRLTVAKTNQWRLQDTSPIASRMEEGEIFAAHPQIDANSYWMVFKEEVSDRTTLPVTEFPFYLSAEVVTVRQVLFRYQVSPMLIGVKNYAYAEPDTYSNVASDTIDIYPPTTKGSNTTASASTTTNTVTASPTHTGAVDPVNPTEGVSIQHTGAVDPADPTQGVNAAQALTGAVSPLVETDAVQVGTLTDYDQGLTIELTTTAATFDLSGTQLSGPIDVGLPQIYTKTNYGNWGEITQLAWHNATTQHQHQIQEHQHEFNHYHIFPQNFVLSSSDEHTHPFTNHKHTYPHSHKMPHTHLMPHNHKMPHSHLMPHTHNMPHSHLMPHTHAMPHVHNIPHNHNMEHVHGLPQHVHPLPALIETFSVDHVPATASYTIFDLEYRVNGNDWEPLISGIPVAGGYTEVDITSTIQDDTGLLRPRQEYNLIEVRRMLNAPLPAGKTAQIRAQLGIRTTIQSIVRYS